MVAAAVYGPVAGVVTAYSAWGIYLACRNRYFRKPAPRASGAGSRRS
jgi:hypothetical protein